MAQKVIIKKEDTTSKLVDALLSEIDQQKTISIHATKFSIEIYIEIRG